MSRPSDRLVDEHGHPLAGVHTLSRAACEDEFDYLRGELQAMAGRGEQGSDLYAAIVDRAGLLADKLDEFERLTPSRAQLRQLAGLNVERGAFDRATTTPRVPRNPLLVPSGTGGRVADEQGFAVRSGETLAQWGTRTGRLHVEDEPMSMGRLLYGMASGDWANAQAEQRAMAEGSPGAGGHLVPTPIAGTIIDLARNMARVVQAGALVVPMVSASVKYPRLLDPFVPAWRAENSPVTERGMTFDAVTLNAKSLAGFVRISVELDDDAVQVPGVVEMNMAKGFAAEIDRAALRGSGTGQEPLGLRGAGSLVPVTALAGAGNGSIPTNYDFLLDAVQVIRAANFEPNAAIAAPRSLTTLSKLHEGGTATGAYLAPPPALSNFPIYPTNQVPTTSVKGTANNASDVFVGQWNEMVIGVRIAVRMRILTERYADYNQVAVQADWRGDVGILQPSAFNIIEGILP
jgi:HK97 family phage major capsid protein